MFPNDIPPLTTMLSAFLPALRDAWWLFAIVAVLAIMRTPWFKGWFGERQVALSLKMRLDPQNYHILHDVTLLHEGGTTQIDHLVIAPSGIFVIETKNMKGWIFGREKDGRWTQQIYRQKTRFQNPLFQNRKHVEAIRASLGVEDFVVHSVVVFVGTAEFKSQRPTNVVLSGADLAWYIKDFQDSVFTVEQCARFVQALQVQRLKPGIRTSLRHAQHVRELLRRS